MSSPCLPDVFEPYAGSSMLGIAREKGVLEFAVHDLRDWALPGVHRQVDDAPYGGGFGMVLRPEPFFDAVRAVSALDERPPRVVLMSPQGEPLTQALAEAAERRGTSAAAVRPLRGVRRAHPHAGGHARSRSATTC